LKVNRNFYTGEVNLLADVQVLTEEVKFFVRKSIEANEKIVAGGNGLGGENKVVFFLNTGRKKEEEWKEKVKVFHAG
jgi:hypothetical protein